MPAKPRHAIPARPRRRKLSPLSAARAYGKDREARVQYLDGQLARREATITDLNTKTNELADRVLKTERLLDELQREPLSALANAYASLVDVAKQRLQPPPSWPGMSPSPVSAPGQMMTQVSPPPASPLVRAVRDHRTARIVLSAIAALTDQVDNGDYR